MTNALNRIPLSANRVSGSQGICVMMANSLMFQRTTSWTDEPLDPKLSGFYGLAMPFVKRGVPVRPIHLENAAYPGTWQDARIVLMTYSNMKPMDPDAHPHIAAWVEKGGVLVYCGRDDDPFQDIDEWWKRDGWSRPSDHLFSLMGIPRNAPEGTYPFGKGCVCVIRRNPKEFVLEPRADAPLVETVNRLYRDRCGAGELAFKNHFYLERGCYDIAGVMDESVSDQPLVLKGRLIDLYDPALPVLKEKTVAPGEYAFLIDVDRVKDPGTPQVLCSGGRIYDEFADGRTYSFRIKGPLGTPCALRVLLPRKPRTVTLSDDGGAPVKDFTQSWDKGSRTVFLLFPNSPDGVNCNISF